MQLSAKMDPPGKATMRYKGVTFMNEIQVATGFLGIAL